MERTVLNRTILVGLGEVGLKALVALRKKIQGSFSEEPPVIGYLGVGIEENPPEGLHAGEYLRIRPASDRAQQRKLFVEESSGALIGILKNTMGRVSYAGVDEGKDWMFSDDPKVNVHLVFSLADVTGSGLCIDVAFLLKTLFGERIILSMHCVQSGLSEPFGKRHAANVYATLQDLDYLNASTTYAHPFRQVLPFETYEIQEAPMDSFYLVGAGEDGGEELASELYAFILLARTIAATDDNMRQHILEGSLDVEEKKAWVSLSRAATFRFTPPYTLEHKEEILKEALAALKYTVHPEGKGYNNLPFVYHPFIVAGPEDQLIVLRQEPRLSGLITLPECPWQEYVDKPLQHIVLLRESGVYPAFQVAGWECELAYYSYEDHRPFHFSEEVYDLMYASRFSLAPNVTITDDELSVYIKSRLFGFIPQEMSLDEAYARRRELRARIFHAEKEQPDRADALYESLRHLSREEFPAQFPCPEDLTDAAYNYATRIL